MISSQKILGFGLIVVFVLVNLLVLAQAGEKAQVSRKIEEEFSAQCKNIFEEKCIQCHSLEKIISFKKGKEWWVGCTTRMSEKPGADISKDDLLHILYYLFKEMPQPEP